MLAIEHYKYDWNYSYELALVVLDLEDLVPDLAVHPNPEVGVSP